MRNNCPFSLFFIFFFSSPLFFDIYDLDETTSNFDLWFTWCQTCRHGGHAVHILDWFNSGRSECPVSDCKCRCQQ